MSGLQGWLPAHIDVEPLTKCNLACPMCFGPSPVRREKLFDLPFWDRLAREIGTRGAQTVVISGGEPTLWRDAAGHRFADLAATMASGGLEVVVSTNGTRPKPLLTAASHLRWVALPIDGATSETRMRMRGDDLTINDLASLLRSLREVNPTLHVKIGTVATRWNVNEIPLIASQIIDTGLPIDTWKIYEYAPRRATLDRLDPAELTLRDGQFDAMAARVQSLVRDAGSPFHLVTSTNRSREVAYLFIGYDGTITIPNIGAGSEDIVVGQLSLEDFRALDDVGSILTRLGSDRDIAPVSANRANFTNTYGTYRLGAAP